MLVVSKIGVPGVGVFGFDGWEGAELWAVLLACSSSARMLSSLASTPATACERREPHRDDFGPPVPEPPPTPPPPPPPPWPDIALQRGVGKTRANVVAIQRRRDR